MRKMIIIICINVVLLALIAGGYKSYKKATESTVKPVEINQDDFYTIDIPIILESDMDVEKIIPQVRTALAIMPPDVTESMINEEYKIFIMSELDTNDKRLSYIDKREKLIKIKYDKDLELLKNLIIFEMCSYADAYYLNLSSSKEFMTLYSEEKDSFYQSLYETDDFSIGMIDERNDDKSLFFALSLKDYLTNKDFLKDRNRKVYNYYKERMTGY